MLMNNNEYIEIIETIKGEIRGAQYKAALSVNRELIMLYYHIGTVINEHKTWGSKFIENAGNGTLLQSDGGTSGRADRCALRHLSDTADRLLRGVHKVTASKSQNLYGHDVSR